MYRGMGMKARRAAYEMLCDLIAGKDAVSAESVRTDACRWYHWAKANHDAGRWFQTDIRVIQNVHQRSHGARHPECRDQDPRAGKGYYIHNANRCCCLDIELTRSWAVKWI